MKDTVIVTVPYTMRHRKYGKILKKNTRLAAHSETPNLSVGDQVTLVETRPYSRTVYFRVTEVINKSKVKVPETKESVPAPETKAKSKVKKTVSKTK